MTTPLSDTTQCTAPSAAPSDPSFALCACCGARRHLSQFPRGLHPSGTVGRSPNCLHCRQPKEVALTLPLLQARIASPCDRCRVQRWEILP